MARWFECAYLGREVELTDEREAHIREEHPEFLTNGFELVGDALADPDIVRQEPSGTLLFSRWYDVAGHRRGGRYAVVSVVTDTGASPRNWIVTAYMARRVPERDVIWRRR